MSSTSRPILASSSVTSSRVSATSTGARVEHVEVAAVVAGCAARGMPRAGTRSSSRRVSADARGAHVPAATPPRSSGCAPFRVTALRPRGRTRGARRPQTRCPPACRPAAGRATARCTPPPPEGRRGGHPGLVREPDPHEDQQEEDAVGEVALPPYALPAAIRKRPGGTSTSEARRDVDPSRRIQAITPTISAVTDTAASPARSASVDDKGVARLRDTAGQVEDRGESSGPALP